MQDWLKIFNTAEKDDRNYLYEYEAYNLLKLFGINFPYYKFILKENIDSLDLSDFKEEVVVKAVAKKLFHKSKVGGVAFVRKTEIKNACYKMSKIDGLVGYLIVNRVEYKKNGASDFFLVSLRNMRDFGLVANFALGGTETEIFAKHSTGNFVSFLINDNTGNFLEKSNWPFKYLDTNAKSELLSFLGKLKDIDLELKNNNLYLEELEINPIAFTKSETKLVPLDAVFRFNKLHDIKKRQEYNLNPLFFPKRVAIAGVSSKNINMGRIILRNLIERGFNTKNLFVVKDNDLTIDDIDCVPNVKQLKDIDVLVLAVKSTIATELIEELANLDNVKHIILIPGGFAETIGGQSLEQRINRALNKSHIGLVGGNCLGIISKKANLDTFFIPKEKLGYDKLEPKPYAFISQSGAFIISKLSKTNMIPQYAVSTGNQTGLVLSDYLAYFVDKDDINTIALYIEGFKPQDGLKLANLISKTNKRILIYKAGRTLEGQKAVGGHTASIASDYGVARDILKQAGAIVLKSLSDFEDTLKLSLLLDEYGFTKEKLLQDNILQKNFNLFVIANAGFETVSASDNIKAPLKFADSLFTKDIITKHKLDTLVNPTNPLDLTPSAEDNVYFDILTKLQTQNSVDFVIFSSIPMTPAMKTLPNELDDKSIFVNLSKFNKKPIVLVVDSGELYDKLVQNSGVVAFREIDRVLRALSNIL